MMTNLEDVFEEVASEVPSEIEVDNSQETDGESTEVMDIDGAEPVGETDTPEMEPVEAVEDDTADVWAQILEQHGDVQVPLQVDGSTVMRSLKDLPANAMMREDYSRKTAELSQQKSAAEWAYDVQAAFQRDPQATIEAFSRAYKLQGGGGEQQQAAVDPYEDYDPDVAAVMRRMDEQNAMLRSELDSVKQFQETTQEREFRSGIEAELANTLSTFEGLDEMDVLAFATENRMRLPMAAEILWNRQQNDSRTTSAAAKAKAKELSQERSGAKRKAGKDAVAATPKGGYDVEPDAGGFSTIGELFELEMLKNSST